MSNTVAGLILLACLAINIAVRFWARRETQRTNAVIAKELARLEALPRRRARRTPSTWHVGT